MNFIRTGIFGMEKHIDEDAFHTNFYSRLRNRISELLASAIFMNVINYKLTSVIPAHHYENATNY